MQNSLYYFYEYLFAIRKDLKEVEKQLDKVDDKDLDNNKKDD